MIDIRPVDAGDIEALYSISLRTALAGEDASHLYRDPKMMGHIYVAPYALLAPDLGLVAQDEQGVAGFVVGTLDTPAWEERLEREWWPALRQCYADPAAIPPEARTLDEFRAFWIHHPLRTPASVTDAYPAHLHLNLLPRLQGRGIGAQLLDAWLELATKRRASAFHVGVNRANPRGIRFWQKQGFGRLSSDEPPEGRPVWMGRLVV